MLLIAMAASRCLVQLSLENELAKSNEGSLDEAARDKIFEKVVGEDKNGYAKTYGMGRKVPRSNSKRCALEEERVKRKKLEEEDKERQQKVNHLVKKLGKVTDFLKMLEEHEGYSLGDFGDDDIESGNEHEFEDEGRNDEEFGDHDTNIEDQENE